MGAGPPSARPLQTVLFADMVDLNPPPPSLEEELGGRRRSRLSMRAPYSVSAVAAAL